MCDAKKKMFTDCKLFLILTFCVEWNSMIVGSQTTQGDPDVMITMHCFMALLSKYAVIFYVCKSSLAIVLVCYFCIVVHFN